MQAVVPNQKNRHREIDLIKFCAIVFMIFVHTYELYAYDEFFESPAYENTFQYILNFIVEFLGGAPAAPVFMFCMGFCLKISRRTNVSKLLKRGVVLIVLGLQVNLLEELLPLVWDKPDLEMLLESLPGLFANDVYFFFAMAFFFFAFAYATKKPVLVSAVACALCLIGGFFLPYKDFSSESSLCNIIVGLFFRTDEYAFFPFCSWIVFPTAGYLFSWFLTTQDDRDKTYKRVFIVALVVILAVSAVYFATDIENSMLNALDCEDSDYYSPNFFSQIWAIAFVLLWMSVAYRIMKRTKDGKVTKVIEWGSNNTMALYIVQWLVLAVLTPVIRVSSNIFYAYLMCLTVTALTFLLTAEIKKRFRFDRKIRMI